MNEYEVPPWLRQAAQNASTLRRQMEPYLPTMQDAQRCADEIRRATPIIQAAMQHAEQIRTAQAAVGPVLHALELVRVMNAGLYELLWPTRHQPAVYVAVPTATASATALPVSVVVSDVGAGTDTLTVQKDTPREAAVPLDAKTVFLVVLRVFAILLPPEDRTTAAGRSDHRQGLPHDRQHRPDHPLAREQQPQPRHER